MSFFLLFLIIAFFLPADGKNRYCREFLLELKNMPVCKIIPSYLENLKKSIIYIEGHGGTGSHYQRPEQKDRNRVSIII